MPKLRKKRGFTTIANHTCQRADLSLQAKGFLSLLLSLPDDWVYNFDNLVTMSQNGHFSTRAAMDELTKHGYLTKQVVKGEGGKFEGWDWVISDEPMTVVTETVVTETIMTEIRSTDERNDNTYKNSTKKKDKETSHTPFPQNVDLEQARKRISEGQENPLKDLKAKFPEFNKVFDQMLRFSRIKAFDQKQMKAKQVLAVLANFKEGDGVRAGNRAMLETTNPSYLFSNFCKFIGQREDLKEAKSPFDPGYKSSIVMATTTKEEQARINFEKSMRQYDSSN